MEMIRTVAKAWNIPDIRKKIIFTLVMLLIFRIGSQIPVPGIDRDILAQTFDSGTGLFAYIVIMGSCVFRVIWIYTVFAYFKTVPSLYILYICSWTLTAIAEFIYFMRIYKEHIKVL